MTTEGIQLVTATEFVTDILCELSLRHINKIRLVDTMEDRRFEKAYELLREQRKHLNIALDFSLVTNPYHGDSSTLRDAIYGLREQGVVSINNPSFKTVEVQVDADDAGYYLNKSAIPRNVVSDIVDRVFTSEGADGQGQLTAEH